MAILFDRLISEENIYKAIFSLESYVFEKELLDDKSLKLYKRLTDKYDTTEIKSTICRCQGKLTEVLVNENSYLKAKVYFKPKKIDDPLDIKKEIYRPMHTADLDTQICIVAMLNLIMFDDSDDERKLSDICKLIPSNFYGNIPSTEVHQIFKHWPKQYADFSANIISANKEYNENRRYQKEVNLDIEKFFPSVDPAYIFSFIWDKISFLYEDVNDKKCLKNILTKLLCLKIDFSDKNEEKTNEILEYYNGDGFNDDLKIKKAPFFNVGIPQGLPQGYLFGNFCMTEVAKIIANKIDGDAYYYVDDSVIFSNIEENKFSKLVNEINDQLKEEIKKPEQINCLPRILESNSELFSEKYTVKIHPHENDSKTTINDIPSQNYLWEVAKPASTTAFQLKATFDDLEDETLKRKLGCLVKYIDKKLKIIENNDQKKLLLRYRKFYLYRLRVLNYRIDNSVSHKAISDFATDYGLEPQDKYTFFKKLEDDIFIREAQMLLKFTTGDKKKQETIIKKVIGLENSFDGKFKNHYFSQVLKQYQKLLLEDNIQYKTLEKEIRNSVPPYLKLNKGESLKKIKEIVEREELPGKLFQYNEGFYKFIFKNSEEFKRKIYNALISYILSVPIEDSFNLIKIDGRVVHYYELRLLVSLRLNYKFNFEAFRAFSLKIHKSTGENEEKVDLTLYEVLPIFKKYINKSEHIDDLILTHRFVNGIWKNGSKFLHFYTLHNEEHSVELIKYCTQITKSLDYFSIKDFDYYILFLACYLHDIAMVIYPNLDDFGKKGDLESEIEITQWKNDFRTNFIEESGNEDMQIFFPGLDDNNRIAKFILQSFQIINNFFEKKIREKHPINGGNFIRKQSDLNFLQELTRKLVAEVSEGHGRETKDVYGLKSKAKDDVVSEKYLMILLRLADLMDMAKDRVSLNVLKQSIEHMPQESKFQWISHLAVDKCTIETDFSLSEISSDSEFLKIAENVEFKIYLNTRILTSMSSYKCKKLKCNIGNKKDQIEILIDQEESACQICNFTSKWMVKKHFYLFAELKDLQKYLKRNSDNSVFETSFKVILVMRNSNQLPSKFIDIVNENIN